MVARWQRGLNLSGHRGSEAILRGLVEDAVFLHASLRDVSSPPDRVADLGSGAGFPGLPMAILEPGAEFELVDARQRRHHFQRAACRELGLSNVRPRLGRIESLDPTPSSWVVAQAVGPIEQVVEWAGPWVEDGGWLFVPSGPEPPRVGVGDHWIAAASSYRTPVGSSDRTVWYARRQNP